LRRRALIGSPEEQVAAAAGPPFPPLDLVFPDAIAGDIGRSIWIFENNSPQRVKIISIKLRVAEGLRTLFDE
jgi:hypothetical protein